MAKFRVSAKLRLTVAQRSGFCCEYCFSQEKYSPDSFSVEHIVPQSKGGSNALSNLAFACQGCNNRKFTTVEAYDHITQSTVFLYHPRNHVWRDHFAWNEDYSEIVGLSAIGRVTIEKIQLNRYGLKNLRKILFSVGKHPPKF
ncbi:MAG: HNH endonuclease [Cyanobacteria bacterium J06621_11]